MADRTIEIVIRGKNVSGEAFDAVKKDLGGVGEAAKKTSAAMDYALGQIAFDALNKVSEGASRLFNTMITSAVESEGELAQLQAVLESTGGAAGVTSEEALELADSLSKLTLYEDDAIVGAETVLLQFTKIGEEVFPRVTQSVLDLSQRMGMDLPNAAKLVGKAMEGEFAGLTRYGIVFDDATKKTIDNMFQMGKTAEAQGMILDALEGKFKGAAAAATDTFGGALSQVKKAWGEFLETIGKGLTKNEAMKNILDSLADTLNKLADAFVKLPEGVQVGIVAFVGLIALVGKLAPALIGMKILLGGVGAAAGGAGLGGALASLGGVITGTLLPALGAAAAALGAAILSPIGLLVLAIGTLGLVIYAFGGDAVKTFKMIADIIAASLKRAGYELNRFWKVVSDWARNLGKNLSAWFKDFGKGIVDGLWAGIQGAWDALKANVEGLLTDLLKMVQDALAAHSPSLVWAKEVGAPMAWGIQQGFQETMMRQAAPAMASMTRPGNAGVGGATNYYSTGHIEVHNPLTQGERGWVRRESESITERTLERILK